MTFQMRGINWIGRNFYNDRATWNAKREELPFIRKIVPIHSVTYRSEYKLEENSTNEEGTQIL